MLATIDTMVVNEKIIRIYSFCQFSPRNTRQMNLKRSIVAKNPTPTTPTDPLKYPTVGEGVCEKLNNLD